MKLHKWSFFGSTKQVWKNHHGNKSKHLKLLQRRFIQSSWIIWPCPRRNGAHFLINEAAILVKLEFYREWVLITSWWLLLRALCILHTRNNLFTDLLEPDIEHQTLQSALTVSDCMQSRTLFCEWYIVVHCFTVQYIRKAAVCRAVHEVYWAQKKLLDVFITFPDLYTDSHTY